MVIYDIDLETNPHCLYCGTNVGPDEFGVCDHLVFFMDSETMEPAVSKLDELLKKMDEEDDIWDFLKENLDDSYIMLSMITPAPSGLEVHYIFHNS
tara:strand:- start:4565 stop:4852 length:288 start_codon:yes stop_codon:yes gene_type:complete